MKTINRWDSQSSASNYPLMADPSKTQWVSTTTLPLAWWPHLTHRALDGPCWSSNVPQGPSWPTGSWVALVDPLTGSCESYLVPCPNESRGRMKNELLMEKQPFKVELCFFKVFLEVAVLLLYSIAYYLPSTHTIFPLFAHNYNELNPITTN